MADYNDRIFKVNEEILEPLNGNQIQVVCRLVEKQDIRISEKGLRKKHLYFLGSLQLVHHLVVQLRFDSQTV